MTRRQLIAMLKIGDPRKTTGWSEDDDRPTLESKLAKLVATKATRTENEIRFAYVLGEIAGDLPRRDEWRSAADFMEGTAELLDTYGIHRPDHYPEVGE